jgi:hypothetical protein
MDGGLCLPDHLQRACEADRLTDAGRRGLSALAFGNNGVLADNDPEKQEKLIKLNTPAGQPGHLP